MADQLEELLTGGAAAEEQTGEETPPAAEEEAAAAQAEAEKRAAEEREAAAQAKAREEEGLRQALIAERRKRQEAEALLMKKQEEEKPYLGEEYEKRFTETEQRFQNELIKQKLDISESFARAKYDDFDAKLEVFSKMVASNPQIYGAMVQQVNPAQFMYELASNQIQLEEMKDPQAYKAKIEAEIRAKVEAELAEKYGKKAPPNLADTRGGAGARPAEWSGPRSLDDVLK